VLSGPVPMNALERMRRTLLPVAPQMVGVLSVVHL
jgi:hypothetical protein